MRRRSPRVTEPDPHDASDCRLVALDEFHGRPLVPGANPPDELRERRTFAPRGGGGLIRAILSH